MKKVVISGANGFVGSSLTKYLSNKGVRVYALVRSKTDKFINNQNVNLIECSMDDYQNLYKIIEDKDIDVFYHFAWEGTVGNNRGNYKVQLRNINNSCDAMKVCKKIKINKFIFAGSIIEYEYKKSIEENNRDISINNIYGVAKATTKSILELLGTNLDIKFIPTIISNIYGPGEKEDRLIKYIIKKGLNNERVSLTSCEQLYDFIYIDDAIKAFEVIGERGVPYCEYYIGNRNCRRLKEFIWEIYDVFQGNIDLGIGDIKFSGVSLDYNEFNKSLLYDQFNYDVDITFKEGIRRTIDWVKRGEI